VGKHGNPIPLEGIDRWFKSSHLDQFGLTSLRSLKVEVSAFYNGAEWFAYVVLIATGGKVIATPSERFDSLRRQKLW
tara:strand:- start:707 stop:937 length:231 start_codon:yes stop_codon:yes gene_type:complete